MYRVANEAGRLVEIAIWSPVSVDEATQWGVDHEAVIASVAGPYACFVDLRGARVFPPEAVNAYVAVMRDEQQLLRTATLLPGSPIVAMQIGRMIREAGHPQRRGFDDGQELAHWLGEVLHDHERERLRHLLEAPGRSLAPWKEHSHERPAPRARGSIPLDGNAGAPRRRSS